MKTALILFGAGFALAAAQNQAASKTGPAPGSRIPEFSAADQDGKIRRFEDLRGEKGAMLVFYRSADW